MQINSLLEDPLKNSRKTVDGAYRAWGNPLHDGNSKGADAFRQFAQAMDASLSSRTADTASRPKP
jgi:hypothetical protein